MNNAGLRETDILLWAEHQADPFRRRASNELAWGNTADGIESVGRSELHAVQSLLAQAVRYWLKAEAWPTVRDAPKLARGGDPVPRRRSRSVHALHAAEY